MAAAIPPIMPQFFIILFLNRAKEVFLNVGQTAQTAGTPVEDSRLTLTLTAVFALSLALWQNPVSHHYTNTTYTFWGKSKACKSSDSCCILNHVIPISVNFTSVVLTDRL